VYIKPEYLPKGMVLNDPGRMGKQECQDLLNHWRVRQHRGADPFRFSNILSSNKLTTEDAVYPPPGDRPDLPDLLGAAEANVRISGISYVALG